MGRKRRGVFPVQHCVRDRTQHRRLWNFRGAFAKSCGAGRAAGERIPGRLLLRIHKKHHPGADENQAGADRQPYRHKENTPAVLRRYRKDTAYVLLAVFAEGMQQSDRNIF